MNTLLGFEASAQPCILSLCDDIQDIVTILGAPRMVEDEAAPNLRARLWIVEFALFHPHLFIKIERYLRPKEPAFTRLIRINHS